MVAASLDPDLLAAGPKPFFGYSDETSLQLFLWNLGLVSYVGGSIMLQFTPGDRVVLARPRR
jgi:muramoyltetrapeptide carboxypeptidase LdcA involved in peptidoglycan recycling